MKKLLLTCSLLGVFATFNAQETETDPAPVERIEENFSSFTDGVSLPQKGWRTTIHYGRITRIGTSSKGLGIRSYSFDDNDNGYYYIISPEITSIDGVKKLKFKMLGTFDVQVGTSVSNDITTIADNFRPVANTTHSHIDPSTANWYESDEILIKERPTAKYIVFKIKERGKHGIVWLDDVYYTDRNLSVSDFGKKETPKFAVDNNSLVFSDEIVSNVKIFSANGSLVATEKVSNKRANISKLSTGVYFLIIEDNNGNITKSKFVKK